MRIMIATDGSSAAKEAARRSIGLLREGATVELVTVIASRYNPMEDAGGIEGPSMTEEEADEEWGEAIASGKAALAETEAALGDSVEIEGETIVPTADRVHTALIALVEKQKPDVLVLGGEEKGWFDRLLHGSVGEKLIHHVPCPLLIVG